MRTLLLCIAAAAVARGQQCVSTVAGVAPAAAAAASSASGLGLGTPFALAFSASQGLLFTTSSAGVWSLYALSGGNATILLCGGRQGAWAAAGVAALSTFFGAHVAVHPLTQAVYFDAHVQAAAYIQMIDAFGNLQVVAGGGAATDFSGAGVPALSASIASSVGVEDNALAFAACVLPLRALSCVVDGRSRSLARRMLHRLPPSLARLFSRARAARAPLTPSHTPPPSCARAATARCTSSSTRTTRR